MTTNTDVADSKILSIEVLYSDLKKSLKEIKDGDVEVLATIESDLLNPNGDEKENITKALKRLMDLAATRAQAEKKEEVDDNTSKA
ncbi:MAG: hypothetical protein KA715_09420 [Xanthomonadaceae bacterium]|nr:hypothetical protein [Xanthomonadaceae bacterium]